MKATKLPVINDPIYGFISINSPLAFDLIKHPYFQRLRRISQMGLSSLVFPSARHSRFEHAIGAMHLMHAAIVTLRKKGVSISKEEQEAMEIAILLHDIGHGPFSHALENSLFLNTHHEEVSLGLIKYLNTQFEGRLDLALRIYENKYERKFMHQLVASQLDVDRLDYLKRDSFFTGATEGNINAQRIIAMMHVADDRLVFEENGLYSVEKFLMARRLMYWQVYLHKTGLAAEMLLQHTFQYLRTREKQGSFTSTNPPLDYFFSKKTLDVTDPADLHQFSLLDDTDIIIALKQWQKHPDPVISSHASGLLFRNLPKIKFKAQPFSKAQIDKKRAKALAKGVSAKDLNNFVFTSSIHCKMYDENQTPIWILKKSGKVKSLEEVSSLFSDKSVYKEETKYFLCSVRAK